MTVSGGRKGSTAVRRGGAGHARSGGVVFTGVPTPIRHPGLSHTPAPLAQPACSARQVRGVDACEEGRREGKERKRGRKKNKQIGRETL